MRTLNPAKWRLMLTPPLKPWKHESTILPRRGKPKISQLTNKILVILRHLQDLILVTHNAQVSLLFHDEGETMTKTKIKLGKFSSHKGKDQGVLYICMTSALFSVSSALVFVIGGNPLPRDSQCDTQATDLWGDLWQLSRSRNHGQTS